MNDDSEGQQTSSKGQKRLRRRVIMVGGLRRRRIEVTGIRFILTTSVGDAPPTDLPASRINLFTKKAYFPAKYQGPH